MKCSITPVVLPPPPREVILTLTEEEASDLLRMISHMTITADRGRRVRLHFEIHEKFLAAGIQPSNDLKVTTS